LSNWFIFIGLFVMIACFGLGTYQHELVHVQNNNVVGFDSELKIGLYNGLPAVGTQRVGEQTREMSNYELSQSFNEAIGYNLTPLLMGIIMTLFIGFIYIGEKVSVHE